MIDSVLFIERSWLEQGCKVGEQVVPLARNFNNIDIESSNNFMVCWHTSHKKLDQSCLT